MKSIADLLYYNRDLLVHSILLFIFACFVVFFGQTGPRKNWKGKTTPKWVFITRTVLKNKQIRLVLCHYIWRQIDDTVCHRVTTYRRDDICSYHVLFPGYRLSIHLSIATYMDGGSYPPHLENNAMLYYDTYRTVSDVRRVYPRGNVCYW